MKATKRLTLSREAVGDLTVDELARVPGGASGVTCPRCVTVHYECPSNPLTDCTVITVTRLTREETCIC